jgi:hypothetical protein
MTQQELGITEIGRQFIEAIIARADIERKYEWHRLAAAIGSENPYYKQWLDANVTVNFWQNKSREEYDAVMRQRGWYQK